LTYFWSLTWPRFGGAFSSTRREARAIIETQRRHRRRKRCPEKRGFSLSLH
jgi:hypothetical protein